MKLISLFLLVFFLFIVLNVQAQKSIFNGKNLKGWTAHGTEKWYVEGGELICESGRDKQYGYLSTNKAYQDFTLTLDFKQEADGNSGFFFQVFY